jgi:hypothetical protein
MRNVALAIAVTACALITFGGAAQASSVAAPCVKGFPGAHAKTVGKATWWNRQDSVRYIVCDGFGLKPSLSIQPTAAFVCDMTAIAIGRTDEVEGFKAEAACDAYEIEKDPKAAATYVGILCGWAAEALGIASEKLGELGSTGCASATVVGTAFGAARESVHEMDVDRDILTRGKCLKYSLTHFGSPWLAVACAKNDPGFSNLQNAGSVLHLCSRETVGLPPGVHGYGIIIQNLSVRGVACKQGLAVALDDTYDDKPPAPWRCVEHGIKPFQCTVPGDHSLAVTFRPGGSAS